MKLRLMAEITDDNGKKIIAPIEVEREIPDMEEFGEPSEFYETFDRYERPAIEARTQILEGVTREYLNQVALKKERDKQKM